MAAICVLSLALAACGSPEGTNAAGGAPDPVGTWGSDGEGEPQLDLSADGSLSGTDGCNRLMGSWEADGADIDFAQTASTRMFCEGVDTWLSDLATATVTADVMTVFDDSGAQIGTLNRSN